MRAQSAPAVAVPHPDTGELSGPIASPSGQELIGMNEFPQMRNWISFSPQHGKLFCRTLNKDYEEFTAVIVESRAVRSMKDEDGKLLCASSDRISADVGRVGRLCETCEDRDEQCQLHWFLTWMDLGNGQLFAHTLSSTATLNFQRYANQLIQDELLPGQVITRIFIEEATRLKTNTPYRRLQFERMDQAQPAS